MLQKVLQEVQKVLQEVQKVLQEVQKVLQENKCKRIRRGRGRVSVKVDCKTSLSDNYNKGTEKRRVTIFQICSASHT